MSKSRPPYPEQMQYDPQRKPTWRWDRANHLVGSGLYLTKRRDDQATHIAVDFLRQIHRCRSELRLRRVQQRFRHLTKAYEIWQGGGEQRLEIETRVLARQGDVGIALEMGLPAPTIQAYADVFFGVRDRIHAVSYIQFQVIGMHPQQPPTPIQLMQASAYHHGPEVIRPWLSYLQEQRHAPDLTSAAGRMAASLDLFLAVHSLPEDEKTRWSLVRRMPFVLKNEWNSAVSVPIARAFRKTTAAIICDLGLSKAQLRPFSYAPLAKSPPRRVKPQQIRQAA